MIFDNLNKVIDPKKPEWFKLENYKPEENKSIEIMEYANKLWENNANKMAKTGLLTELDIHSFTLLCVAYGEFINYTKKIAEEGNNQEQAYLTHQDKAYNRYANMCEEFKVKPVNRKEIEAEIIKGNEPEIQDLLDGSVRGN